MHRPFRGFSLIEIMTVALVVAVITAVALPQITAKVLEREEQHAAEQVSQWLEAVRNEARRERDCLRVYVTQPSGGDGQMKIKRVECGTGNFIGGPPVTVAPLALNTRIIKKVLAGPSAYYAYDVIFSPEGGLDKLSCNYDGQRDIEVVFRSLRKAMLVITPAVGGVRRTS